MTLLTLCEDITDPSKSVLPKNHQLGPRPVMLPLALVSRLVTLRAGCKNFSRLKTGAPLRPLLEY